MPRVKVARKSTAIDMTAMCDVAFLLLTFFILSAKPKSQDPVKAEIPAATSISTIPETDFATILIGSGKVFFGVEGDDVRKKTLSLMAEKYKMSFTPDEANAFSGLQSFGVPISQLHQLLAMSSKDRASLVQPGIPVDTTATNELFDWVHSARLANKFLHDKDLKIGIKGDSQEEYPTVDKVISTLQKQRVDRFNLITSLKTAK
ncbi:biopolymer transporter ExbD [Mucilaginibacter sp. X5P1]|uniref:biopolymer transporter ExbD n=1 Tax=Mucilaginibacter sp. X5P1 TaxID=2723088 RepID=UPI0016181582|nr:biopolymer transporter ExbD [Mucilaginibacter sp. X5P1]MBB6139047.1 biopolymer transport protein ExbD [Mucilaginibacter sp. X5P1]